MTSSSKGVSFKVRNFYLKTHIDQSSIFKEKYSVIQKKTYQMIKNHNEGLTKANPFSDCLPAYKMVPKTGNTIEPPLKSLDLLK